MCCNTKDTLKTVEYTDPGVMYCLASGLYCYYNKDKSGFYSWVDNLKRRLFVPCTWEFVPCQNVEAGSKNYAVLMSFALLQCCLDGSFNCCKSKMYTSCLRLIAKYMVEGTPSTKSTFTLNRYAGDCCLALRYLSLYLYHSDVNSLRNPNFDIEDYEKVVRLQLSLNPFDSKTPVILATTALTSLC